jgi:hypothetical protein
MRVGLAFAAGMIGWAVMVGLTILLRAIGATELNLSMIVGSLFTGQVSSGTWALGFVAGLIISGLIALVYAAVFEGLQRSNWRLGLLGGAVHAAIGGVFFAAMSSFHPAMPDMITPPGPYAANYGTLTAVGFVALHLLFGAIVGGMYKTVHVPTPPSRLQPTPEEHAIGAGPSTRRRY